MRAATASVVVLSMVAAGCKRESLPPAAQPIYNKESGKLERLILDANRNGTPDGWSYMDGVRVVRAEIDKNEDGRVERWEYFDSQGKLEKVGYSRGADGRVDAWAYPGADGKVTRIDLSRSRNGNVDRIEWYEAGQLVRAAEDTDGDGHSEKWETHSGGRVATVVFDENSDRQPDRRLTYDGSGRLLTIETQPDGRGGFLKSTKVEAGAEQGAR